LIAHALDGGFHLVQGDLRIADLLLDAAAKDRGFAGQVDQVIEQFGRDLDHVRPGIGLLRGFGFAVTGSETALALQAVPGG
jgi:hypothetical protein